VLASDPVLLLLDEPNRGMSPEETDETMVPHPRAARARTVVLVEHKMKLVMGISTASRCCTRAGAGRRHAGDEIPRQRLVQETYLGASR